jgi:hypothetical protein
MLPAATIPCEPPKPGEPTTVGRVDVALAGGFAHGEVPTGSSSTSRVLDAGGVVGILDFLLLLAHWGPCPLE